MALRIRGGITGAGNRTVKEIKREPWTCANGHENKWNHTRCFTLGCNVPRERKAAA